MTGLQHAARVGLLMAGAALLLGWELRHTEASFADGLRYIHRAESIEGRAGAEAVLHGVDHPLHPLGIVAAHRVMGGTGPASWQRAALALGFTSAVLLVVPTYLLALELFGPTTAWLACALVALNPIVAYIVVNVLSETTFLLFWTFGLWSAARFWREGRFLWLPLAIVWGALAYLTRPEGMLLPAAVVLTLLVLPLAPAIRINWPRWRAALAFLMGGLVLCAGPYVALKGGLGTKPAIARVLGLAPRSDPMGLEREKPLPVGQSTIETYRFATVRMLKVFRAAVTPPLFLFSLLGIGLAARDRSRTRDWLFLSIVLAASAFGLVRLHATGGYCTVRHGLVPGMLLTLAAARGLAWTMEKAAVPGRWLGSTAERIRPGPVVWAALFVGFVVLPNVPIRKPAAAGPFSVYRAAGEWIAEHTGPSTSAGAESGVLDLTDWSLYFSQRTGFPFAKVYDAPRHPEVRWVVVRQPHVKGHWHYSQVVRDLIGDRRPAALVPPVARRGQVQIQIYDRQSPEAQTQTQTQTQTATAPDGAVEGPGTRRR